MSIAGLERVQTIHNIDRFAFVVGAPRCGTTTLANFLKHHPDVRFPLTKETHFFALNDFRGVPGSALRREVESEYLARFFPADHDGGRLAADCSVSYLYTPEQLEAVLRIWPESRFVVAFRNPLEMLPSLHQRLLFLGDETLTRFEDAWAAVPDRAEGRRIPRSCADPRWLRYDQAARYGTYLQRLFATVGRERCMVVIFDDLAADPAREYRRMMDFLGLRSLERSTDFKPRRQSHGVRYYWLQRLLQRPPRSVRKFVAGPRHRIRHRKLDGDAADSGLVDNLFAVRKRVLHWNRIPPVRQPLSPSLEQEIRATFEGEILRLGNLIGRDLGHWFGERAAFQPGTEASEARMFDWLTKSAEPAKV